MTRFDFLITYRPGVQQGKADALSRRSYLAPRPGEPTFDNQKQVLLGPDRLRLMTTHVFEAPLDSSLLKSIRTDIKADAFAQDILDHIIENRASCSRSANDRKDYHLFTWDDGLLFRNNQLYIPDGLARRQVLQQCHDIPMAGHFGVQKTLELVTRRYWWPQLRKGFICFRIPNKCLIFLGELSERQHNL